MGYSYKDKRIKSFITEQEIIDSFISIEAPLCQAGYKYSYSESENCFFMNPQPDAESMDLFYNGHGKLLTKEVIEETHSEYEKGGRNQEFASHISSYIHKYKKSGDWLDFGCGPGILLSHNKKDFTVTGVEISDIAREVLQEKGIASSKGFEDLGDQKFDVITAIDVIEHVPDPSDFVLQLSRHLNDEGILFLRLPVIDGILFDKQYPERWKFVYAPYHLHMLSKKSIKCIAKKHNFDIDIIDDPKMHATWDLFYIRFLQGRIYDNKISKQIFSLVYKMINPFLKRRYSADCVFAVIKRKA